MSSIAWDTWIPRVTLKTKLSTTWLLLFPGCRGIPALLSHTRRGERVILLSWHWFVWAPCLRVIGCLAPPGQSESSYPNIQIQKQWTLRLSHLFNLSASTCIILWQPSFHVPLAHNRVCSSYGGACGLPPSGLLVGIGTQAELAACFCVQEPQEGGLPRETR